MKKIISIMLSLCLAVTTLAAVLPSSAAAKTQVTPNLINTGDVEIDTCSGRVVAIIVKCRSKLLNFGNKQDDIKICWEQIEVIGDETILVNIDCVPGCCKAQKSSGFINNLFREG